MPLELRQFQSDMIQSAREKLRTVHSLLLQAPTGAGKTVLSAYMTGSAVSKNKRVWFVVHRRELVNQSAKTFDFVGIQYGIIAAGYDPNWRRPVQIAGIQTLARRLHRLQPPDIVIWDEAHHVAAKSWETVFRMFPHAHHVGLTATPQRLDGKGLGKYFEDMIVGPSTAWLIENGYLSPYRLFSIPGVKTEGMHHVAGDFNRKEVIQALERSTVMGDAVSHYMKHAMGRRGIVFEASRERSERAAKAFRDAGIPAAHVDGETDPAVRDRAMRDLEAGHLRILCNVDLFGEGVDVPALECIFLCRPTDSLSVYLQQVGRGLRPCDGKEDCLIFDHAGNASRHGRPDDERQWSLAGTAEEKRQSKPGIAVRQCPFCYAVSPPQSKDCAECGKPFPVYARVIEQVEGELTEDAATAARKAAVIAQASAQSLDTLIELGRLRGYKNPTAWAQHVWAAREAKAAGKHRIDAKPVQARTQETAGG